MTSSSTKTDTLEFADQASRDLLAFLHLTRFDDWFADARIHVWRDIRERQNATLDLPEAGRLHVKRLRPPTGGEVFREVGGVRLLESAGIPSVPLVAWGVGKDRSGVLVTRDLAGFTPADRLLQEGRTFDDLVEPTVNVAARLHRAGLHHRDLYLCHFLSREGEIRLIDAARVRKMPWLTRRRWIVKDLAQFRYSGLEAGVGEEDLDAWLRLWAEHVDTRPHRWRDAVRRKTDRIARHDLHLRQRQPERRTSLSD